MIKVCVIGLGYVGLPISLKISNNFTTIGFDLNKDRVANLKKYVDKNNEFKKKDFNKKKLSFTSNPNEIKSCNFFIICVPTPIKKSKLPELNYIEKSFITISKILKEKDIIVLESTVYPGVTRKYINLLEQKTKLKNNKDFFTCYSPERINPGDKKNDLSKINKILAYEGKNLLIKKKLTNVYSKICKKLILTNKLEEAEAAKGIENIQRDLNISLFNEILLICEKLNLNFNKVIKLAGTKWNFIEFSPGLVGGHCLPVDPYYLAYIAKKNKYNPKVTLAGRSINEYMKDYVIIYTNQKIKNLNYNLKKIRIFIIGMTYKYGVSDTRNAQNLEILNYFKKRFNVVGYDPFLNNEKFNKISLNNKDIYLFLTKGKKYKVIADKIKKINPKNIIDPFYYY